MIANKMKNQSLLALACGDSYGLSYEMEGFIGCKFKIEELPNVPINLYTTDDTAMAMILVKHYHKHKKISVPILRKEYRHWAIEEGDSDGIGMHTKNVLIHKSKNKDSQGNGALMRNIPFGCQLIDDGFSFNKAVKMMNKDSAITHENETIFIINTLALDLALNGIEILSKQEYQDIISRLHFGITAWVIHSLYIVIDALKKDLSFLDGFKYIVSQGGDTDTNCAIYGAIKGYKEDISDSLDISDFLTPVMVKNLI